MDHATQYEMTSEGSMEPMKKNKARTAITIDPDLWARAKMDCENRSEAAGRKVSFSALVEEALASILPLSDC